MARKDISARKLSWTIPGENPIALEHTDVVPALWCSCSLSSGYVVRWSAVPPSRPPGTWQDARAAEDLGLIDLAGISKHYQIGPVEVRALDGVDLHVADGEFVVVLGPSGSGKTTLLNIIGALDTPTSGSVLGRRTRHHRSLAFRALRAQAPDRELHFPELQPLPWPHGPGERRVRHGCGWKNVAAPIPQRCWNPSASATARTTSPTSFRAANSSASP